MSYASGNQIETYPNLPGEGRSMRGLSKATVELIAFARKLLEKFHPMTLRQLHYAIFSAAAITYANTQADYKRLSRATTYARRAYRDWELRRDPTFDEVKAYLATGKLAAPVNGIPPEWMIDKTREGESISVWSDDTKFIEALKSSYRRDNWQDQPNYCEVWSEKATVLGSIRPLAEKFGVTLRTCHGYSSAGMEQEVGSYFSEIEKPITIFYLGDHDPSGHGIEANAHKKVQESSGIRFEMRRLAIHADDIRAFSLPPQKMKNTDSRAEGFRKRFGVNAATVELDALPVDELRRRIAEAIDGLLDHERWNRALAVQEVEFDSIADFAEKWKRVKSQDQRGDAV